MLVRNANNPILQAQPDINWCSKKVYNCAVVFEDGIYKMLFRAVGDDWISRLGLATSKDGVHFEIDATPAMEPTKEWEMAGCEDPRLTKIDGKYYVGYTAYDGTTARASLTASDDLKNWGEKRILFPNWSQSIRGDLPTNWSKAAALFPEKIDGNYYLFFGDSQIWAAKSTDLKDWQTIRPSVLSARPGMFDADFVEMGPPPILTEHGWLVLYHGISHTAMSIYSLGAALFDRNNPLLCLWRSNGPLLTPSERYEVVGLVDIVPGGFDTLRSLDSNQIENMANHDELPRVVFCCGAVVEGDKMRLYYSGGDTVLCLATVDFETIFNS